MELFQGMGQALSNNMIDIFSAALLCFFAVRERLRGSLTRYMLIAAASVIIFTLIYLPLFNAFGIARNLCLLPYLAAAFFFYRRAAQAEPLKLLFLMLLALNYHFFLNPVNFCALYLFGIREVGAPYIWLDVALNGCITAATLPFMMWFVRRKLWPLMQPPGGGEWKLLWTLPAVFTLLHFLFYSALSDELYELPVYSFLLIFLGICAFFTYYIILRVLKSADENARSLERMEQVNKQIAMQGDRFTEIAEHFSEMKILHHDMRHHLATLEGMMAERQYDQAEKYLQEYASAANDIGEAQLCANYVVDVIARRYAAFAKKQGIETNFSLLLPQNAGVADTDLCIVLGNLIENAVQACSTQQAGKKFIRVQAKAEDGKILIAVDNSYEESSRHSESNGMGITSVHAIASKYSGMAEFEKKDGVFLASVLLYMA